MTIQKIDPTYPTYPFGEVFVKDSNESRAFVQEMNQKMDKFLEICREGDDRLAVHVTEMAKIDDETQRELKSLELMEMHMSKKFCNKTCEFVETKPVPLSQNVSEIMNDSFTKKLLNLIQKFFNFFVRN